MKNVFISKVFGEVLQISSDYQQTETSLYLQVSLQIMQLPG